MAISVIDFSKIDGDERDRTLSEIAAGFEEWGFFQLVNTGISEELLERVKKVCTECYNLREEEFRSSNPAVKALEGLAAQEGERLTAKRLTDVDWEDVFTLQDDNPWPSNPPAFKETMMEFRRELKKLAERILAIMEDLLGMEEGHIKKVFSNDGEAEPFFGTKVSHYPACPRPERVDGLRAHTDAGGLILLFQDDRIGGLQVLKDGRWVDVQPVKNAIVVNTGDQIEVLSNGRYKSAWHRVLANHDGTRRSLASFYNPARMATIAPAIAAVATTDTEAPAAAYPAFSFGDYMEVYVKQKFQAKESRFAAMVTK